MQLRDLTSKWSKVYADIRGLRDVWSQMTVGGRNQRSQAER